MLRLLGLADGTAQGDRSQRGLDRLAAFSDAVVAIAITLIVLPLVDLAGERGADPAELLARDGYRLAAAGLTFVVVAELWREHHAGLATAVRDSRLLVTLDLAWLAAVVFLPVPTSLLFAPGEGGGASDLVVALYAATAAVAGGLMRAMEWEVRRHCVETPFHATRRALVLGWSRPVLLALVAVLAGSGLGLRALVVLVVVPPLRWYALLRPGRAAPAGDR